MSPKISYQHVPLLPPSSCGGYSLPFPVDFPVELPPYGETREYFGIVAHVRGGEGISCIFGDPITNIVVTCLDEAALITFEGVAYGGCQSTTMVTVQKVRGINSVEQ